MRLVAPVLALTLLLGTAASAQAEGQIAVVDMVELLKSHPKLKDIDAAADKAQKDAEDFAKAGGESLKTLQGKIDLESPLSPTRVALEKEYAKQAAMLQFEMEWRKRDVQREYTKGMEQLYASIEAVVARYAREQKLLLVLNKAKEDLKAGSSDDFGLKVRLRSVVYSDAALDITETIKKLIPR
jgi:Skp family chaperone for outer membrane proteins